MTDNEPTIHEYEITTPNGTDVEITVKFGRIDVRVPEMKLNSHWVELTQKRGHDVLDLGRQRGERMYVPVDDIVNDLREAVKDTEDEEAEDYVERSEPNRHTLGSGGLLNQDRSMSEEAAEELHKKEKTGEWYSDKN